MMLDHWGYLDLCLCRELGQHCNEATMSLSALRIVRAKAETAFDESHYRFTSAAEGNKALIFIVRL